MNFWSRRIVPDLLRFVGEATVGAVEEFKVSDMLGSTGVNKDGVKVAFLGESFKRVFGPLVEQKVQAVKLIMCQFERRANGFTIAPTLPAERRATTIGQAYKLVKDQAKGEMGPLLVKHRRANLFPCYGNDGYIWLVSVGLDRDGWCFGAHQFDSSSKWDAGSQLLYL